MPSWELFEQQDQAYRDSVLPPEVTARVSVEQAGTFGWERYVGPTGTRIGMKTFGASAPLKELQKKFGFTSRARGRRRSGPARAAAGGGVGPMKVGIAADHAGYVLKQDLIPSLRSLGAEVEDLGTHGPEPVDYPDVAERLARAVLSGAGGARRADLRERRGSLGGGQQVPRHPRRPLP